DRLDVFGGSLVTLDDDFIMDDVDDSDVGVAIVFGDQMEGALEDVGAGSLHRRITGGAGDGAARRFVIRVEAIKDAPVCRRPDFSLREGALFALFQKPVDIP